MDGWMNGLSIFSYPYPEHLYGERPKLFISHQLSKQPWKYPKGFWSRSFYGSEGLPLPNQQHQCTGGRM